MYEEKSEGRDLLRIGLGIALLIALTTVFVVTGINTKKVTEKQGMKYLEFAVNRSAEELHQSFYRQVENVQAMAHMSAHLVEKKDMDTDMLRHLLSQTSFDGIEYVDSNGHCVNINGNEWDVSDRQYFTDAMKGSGYAYDKSEERRGNGSLLFYAPITTDSGEFRGALIGYYKQATLKNMLDISFWGEDSTRLLCTADGTIISSNADVSKYISVMDYFTAINHLKIEDKKAFSQMVLEQRGRFAFRNGNNSEMGVVSALGGGEFILLEEIPSRTLFKLYAPEHKLVQIMFIGIIVCLGVYFCAMYLYVLRKRKVLVESNRKISQLLKGVQGLFEYTFQVDLEKETYELLESNQHAERTFSSTGKFSRFEKDMRRMQFGGDPDKSLLDYLTPQHIRAQMSRKTDILNLEYNESDDPSKWHTIHIICLERKADLPTKVLVAIVDISQQKKSQTFQKKATEMLYGKTYELVGNIDCKNETIVVVDSNVTDPIYQIREPISYKELIEYEANYCIPAEDRKEYLEDVNLQNIVQKLNLQGRTYVTCRHYTGRGELRVMKYSFGYYNDSRDVIIWAAEDITEAADVDPLTGVLNLDGFARKVSYRLSRTDSDVQYAVLHFNIKDFKAVNTKFGYKTGDNVLKKMGEILCQSELRPLETARDTADHFYCLVETSRLSPSIVTKICQTGLKTDGHAVLTRMHCGIFLIKDGEYDVRVMCDKARLACTEIRSEYIKPYAFYRSGMEDAFLVSTEILSDFENALKERQFKVWYQPVLEIASGKIVSAEALIRWEHPVRGVISPGLFLPTLEEKGNISRLDLFVQEEVQSHLQRRLSSGQRAVPVAINLSRMDFVDARTAEAFQVMLNSFPYSYSYIRLEITESAFIDVPEFMKDILLKLHSKNMKILIDDFGTGYSSLSCIAGETFDIVKLDMSFINNIGRDWKTEVIICNVINMCHEMGVEVIAEGVETELQYEFLRDNNCDYMQGYYFSKPMPVEDFEALLDRKNH